MSSEASWRGLLDAVRRSPSDRGASALDTAVELGVDVAAGVIACSITEQADEGWRTPHASEVVAIRLDAAQYAAGVGPCVDAAGTGLAVRLTPIADASVQYATFVAAAAANSVRASLSVPVPNRTTPTALNLYATEDAAFDGRRPQQVADLLARCCGVLLGDTPAHTPANTSAVPSVVGPDEPLTEVTARLDGATVDRALRIVQRTRNVSREEAQLWLIRRSVAEGRSMVTVARDVVAADGPGMPGAR